MKKDSAKDIKIAFFDVDGTLVDMEKKVITPAMIETLKHLKENGIILCMATGRGPYLVPSFPGIDFDVFLSYNASYCYTKDEVIFSNPIPKEDVKAIVENASEIHRPVFLAGVEGGGANGCDKDLADYFAIAKSKVNVLDNFDFEKLMDKKMNELGYSPEEQLKIKSQLLVLAYNPDCPKYLSKFRFISIESSQDRHNEYHGYLREWLLMSPKDFVVCFLPKIYGQTLMCAQVDKYGIEGNPPREIEPIDGDKWFKQIHGIETDKEKTLGEHDFLGFEPIKNMSKGALKLQYFANNILKNAIKNSQRQNEKKFVPLPNIQNLAANSLQQRYMFARAVITGYKLLQQVRHTDKSQIDQYANWRRSIPTVGLD